MTGDRFSDSSTVRRIQLGARLRELRLARGLSRADAGYTIRASESKISRIEMGRIGVKERDIADLLKLYGVDDPIEQARLLARKANEPSWWHAYGDVLDISLHNYLSLEQAAELIRTYEIQFVPGLLQTEDYARAAIRLGHDTAGREEIDRRTGLRMARTELLNRPDSPHMWTVLDEAVLRRPIGGREVMRSQLEALLESCRRPNLRIQVMPFGTGGPPAAGGSFSILRFPFASARTARSAAGSRSSSSNPARCPRPSRARSPSPTPQRSAPCTSPFRSIWWSPTTWTRAVPRPAPRRPG